MDGDIFVLLFLIFIIIGPFWIYSELDKFRKLGLKINPGLYTLLYIGVGLGLLYFVLLLFPSLSLILIFPPIIYLIQREYLREKISKIQPESSVSPNSSVAPTQTKSSKYFLAIGFVLLSFFIIMMIFGFIFFSQF